VGVYLTTAAVLLPYLILSWFLGSWLKLSGSDLWILRIGLSVLGLFAAGVFVWFRRRYKAAPDGAAALSAESLEDIDQPVREASVRLRNSSLGKRATLGKLPVIFVLGESSSTKTSTIINSGLDPELLAGRAYQDNNVLATRTANVWYTRQAVFVDCAGDIVNQPGRWARLVRLVQPGRISNTVGKGQLAPRAVLICYSAENFFAQGAGESTLAAAKKFNARLQEVSRILSISFPVYVLFTKLDRISFFAEYAQNLTKEEAAEVLGTTLPVRPAQSAGIYAEEEARRLTKAFDEIFYSLAEKRLDLLGREHQSDKQPSIYEFPRELRKVRTFVSEFLVNLARPSQLQVNPFLRGFYFSGVRAVLVEDVAGAAMQSIATESAPPDAGATRMFNADRFRQLQAAAPARVAGSRKVPQWAFLTRLFNDVILKDRVALSASGFSARSNLLRRILFAVVVAIGLVCAGGFLVSFFQNRSLETEVMSAARDIPAVQLKDKQLPALDDLQRLERLRVAVATLAQYEKDGPPLRLRWGLYIGDGLLPQAQQLYFTRFRQLLFGQAQANLLSWLRGLPPAPGANDSYEKSYNALKAYLITTPYNSKSTQEFLSPVLMSHWSAGREIDQERTDLAKRQFDLYSTQLAGFNPYSAANDTAAIAQARTYLSQFGGIDRFYLPLIGEADSKNRGLSFNEQFKDSVGVINSNYKVRGAFTADGFKYMQDALRQPQRYMGGEEWVLGKQAASQLDAATLQQKLTERYYGDFVNEWRTALGRSHVVPFDKNEADQKLGKLTNATSPLLEVLWFVSHHTNVGVPTVTEPFMPVQAVEPPGPPDKALPDQYITPTNQPYITALSKLQGDLGLYIHDASSNPALATQALTSAAAARVAVTQVVGARVDQRYHTEEVVRQLLEEPIKWAEQVVSRGPVDALNKGGQGLCSKFEEMRRNYYPFDPSSSVDLPLTKLQEIFAPGTGALWTFYNDPNTKLSTYLVKQGLRYQPIDSEVVKISPGFVAFFNRAAAMSGALYAEGPSAPRFSYKLGQLKTDVTGLTIKIGDQSIAEGEALKQFSWTGKEDVQVSANGAPYGAYTGPWAVFRFVSGAKWTDLSSGMADLHRQMESNGQLLHTPDGKVMYYAYQLQLTGANPFRRSDWSEMWCVSRVAH
jgi:type VI secretion system protein ImpL